MLKYFWIMFIFAVMIVLTGYHEVKETSERRIKKVADHMGEIKLKVLPKGKVFSLVDCIAIALQLKTVVNLV